MRLKVLIITTFDNYCWDSSTLNSHYSLAVTFCKLIFSSHTA